jgi:vacuolar-type H+-ATPase subunit I/STV1
MNEKPFTPEELIKISNQRIEKLEEQVSDLIKVYKYLNERLNLQNEAFNELAKEKENLNSRLKVLENVQR